MFGLWWCKEIVGRLPDDLAELRESKEPADKAIVIFFWMVTVPIAAAIALFLWGLGQNVMSLFR